MDAHVGEFRSYSLRVLYDIDPWLASISGLCSVRHLLFLLCQSHPERLYIFVILALYPPIS